MTENPYSAPAEVVENPVPMNDRSESFSSIAKAIFLSWEKLRLVYVGILALVSILLVGPGGVLNFRILMDLITGAIVANMLFLAGPIVETYVSWLGYREQWPRWLLFVGGTFLSILLTIGVLAHAASGPNGF